MPNTAALPPRNIAPVRPQADTRAMHANYANTAAHAPSVRLNRRGGLHTHDIPSGQAHIQRRRTQSNLRG